MPTRCYPYLVRGVMVVGLRPVGETGGSLPHHFCFVSSVSTAGTFTVGGDRGPERERRRRRIWIDGSEGSVECDMEGKHVRCTPKD